MKSIIQEEKQHGMQAENPNHDRVRVFGNIVIAIIH
jgi:hypothetical protein